MTQKPGQSLLVITWLLWVLSITTTPLSAYLFHTLVAPDPGDDFGMGPFLSGAILGAILSLAFGGTALATAFTLRRRRPLPNLSLRILERVVLIAPPVALLCAAGMLIGALGIVGALVFVGATVIVAAVLG